MPGPWSITRTSASAGRRRRPARGPAPSAGEYLSAFSIRFTSTRSIWLGVDAHRRRLAPASATSTRLRRRAELVERLRDEVVDRPDLRARAAPRRPASRERSSRLPTRRSSRSASARIVASSSRAVGVVERRGRRCASALAEVEDRHQRRAQVVADRAQDRGLDRVAAAQRLGLERLAREPLAVDRDAEQRRERGQQAPPRRRAAAPRAARAGSCRRAGRAASERS